MPDRYDWDDYDVGRADVTIPAFGWSIPVLMFPEEGRQVTAAMEARLADVLALTTEDRDRLQSLLWDYMGFLFTVADFGVEQRAGESSVEAHRRFFEIETPAATLARTVARGIHIFEEDDTLTHRLAAIKVEDPGGEILMVIVRDGRIYDVVEDGAVLSSYDVDPVAPSEQRKALLK